MTIRGCITLILTLSSLALCSCDQSRPSAPTTAPTAEPVFQLELKPLTPLLPNRPTHVTVDPLGNVYWVQETDRSDDTLFVIGEGDVPRATQLSAASVSAALGTPAGRGHIHGVTSGPMGELYFYFYGLLERTPLAAVGRYFPKTATIQILADTTAVAAATDMGRSLPLARGSVISDGHFIWLWVRHTDAWCIFRIDPRKLPSSGPAPLPKAFEKVTLDERPIDLTRDEYDLSAGPEQNLFLLDPVEGRVLKIAPDGVATVVRSLLGVPSALSTPSVDRKGQLLLFAAANSPPIEPSKLEEINHPKPPTVTYPAMLIFGEDNHVIGIGRDDILAYPGFPVFGLRLREMIANPGEEGWVSYDAGSGELLRLKIREKLWQ